MAHLTAPTVAPGATYRAVFRVAGTTAFMAYGLGNLSDSIGKGQLWSMTIKEVIDGLVYALADGRDIRLAVAARNKMCRELIICVRQKSKEGPHRPAIGLFVAQGDNGIDAHGARGWQIGSDDADGHEDDREK